MKVVACMVLVSVCERGVVWVGGGGEIEERGGEGVGGERPPSDPACTGDEEVTDSPVGDGVRKDV